MFSDLFWALYWIDILSAFGRNVFGAFLLGIILGGIMLLIKEFQRKPLSTGVFAAGFLPAFLAVSLLSFIPSKSTMYMMLGVKTTENVVSSPLGQKLQQIVDLEVDGYLKKLQPKSKE
jgi:hypothetical protein